MFYSGIISFLKRHWWWIVPLLIFDFFMIHRFLNPPRQTPPEQKKPAQELKQQPVEPADLTYTYPTDQKNLHLTNSTSVYQPTASGRVQSALYGTTRIIQSGGRLLRAFHAGLDIAPMQKDKRGRPLDNIYAVTDGSRLF